MRGIIIGVTLTMCAFIAVLPLAPQLAGAQAPFNLEQALTGAKTPADHEAIASHYDRESATAKAKADEHRRLAETYRTLSVSPRGQVPSMEQHCRDLAQHYERAAAENATLATAHRQMAREATQQKP